MSGNIGSADFAKVISILYYIRSPITRISGNRCAKSVKIWVNTVIPKYLTSSFDYGYHLDKIGALNLTQFHPILLLINRMILNFNQ